MGEIVNCVCGKTITKPHYNKHCRSESHKTYMQNNGLKDDERVYEFKTPVYIRKARAQYYERNKDTISADRSAKIICECGITVSCGHLSRHQKSKKHLACVNTKK